MASEYLDTAMAYEIASYLRWVVGKRRQGELLAKHLLKAASKPGFSEARYVDFLAKTHFPRATQEYLGRRQAHQWQEYAPMPVRREAGRIFVEHVLDGEWAPEGSPRSNPSRVRTGHAHPSTVVPGLRYLVHGVDAVGKSRSVRAHTVKAARKSRAAHAIKNGSIIDTLRGKTVMATISGGTSHRTGAKKPWTKSTITKKSTGKRGPRKRK